MERHCTDRWRTVKLRLRQLRLRTEELTRRRLGIENFESLEQAFGKDLMAEVVGMNRVAHQESKQMGRLCRQFLPVTGLIARRTFSDRATARIVSMYISRIRFAINPGTGQDGTRGLVHGQDGGRECLVAATDCDEVGVELVAHSACRAADAPDPRPRWPDTSA